MKTSKNDPFDLELCIRGLGNLLTRMHSDIYEYIYYLTFRRSRKAYRLEFTDPHLHPVEQIDFFEDTGDVYVSSCLSARNKLVDFKDYLTLRWGIDELSDLEDEVISLQAERYSPYFLYYKSSKSYIRMTLYYLRTLNECISSLYLYACALTAGSYKIPLILKRQFKLGDELSLRLLNEDDNEVALLKALIINLKQDLSHFKSLVKNREDRALAAKAKRDLKNTKLIAANNRITRRNRRLGCY